jgi:hypothetical protein
MLGTPASCSICCSGAGITKGKADWKGCADALCDAGAGGYERGPYPDRGGYGAERGYPGEYERGGYDRSYPPSAAYGCVARPPCCLAYACVQFIRMHAVRCPLETCPMRTFQSDAGKRSPCCRMGGLPAWCHKHDRMMKAVQTPILAGWVCRRSAGYDRPADPYGYPAKDPYARRAHHSSCLHLFLRSSRLPARVYDNCKLGASHEDGLQCCCGAMHRVQCLEVPRMRRRCLFWRGCRDPYGYDEAPPAYAYDRAAPAYDRGGGYAAPAAYDRPGASATDRCACHTSFQHWRCAVHRKLVSEGG